MFSTLFYVPERTIYVAIVFNKVNDNSLSFIHTWHEMQLFPNKRRINYEYYFLDDWAEAIHSKIK